VRFLTTDCRGWPLLALGLSGCVTRNAPLASPRTPDVVPAIAAVVRERLTLVGTSTVLLRDTPPSGRPFLTSVQRDSLQALLGPQFRIGWADRDTGCDPASGARCLLLSLLSVQSRRDTLTLRLRWKAVTVTRCGAGYEATFAVVQRATGPAVVAVKDEDYEDCGV